jgi:hypothetical protein
MTVDPVTGGRADKGQGQEEEANHLIPQGSKGFDHPWDDVPDKLNAVLYNPAFDHIFMVPKLPIALIVG